MNKTVEIVFVIDRSGSMSGKESDVIGGFNAMLDKQLKEETHAYVSTVMFSDDSSVLHDRLLLMDIPFMTPETYQVGGCTALYDAIGDAIHHIRNVHKYVRPEDKPSRTMFVIMTDGLENASWKYDNASIRKLIEQQKEHGWDFIYIGADIDAFSLARSVGINPRRAVNFSKSKDSFGDCFEAVGKVMTFYAKSETDDLIEDDSFEDIFKIFKKQR